jgi:hypothetical protein
MKRSEKVSKSAGLGGCLPSLVLFMTGFSTSISWNMAAAFLSLGFGIVGVIGLITARGIAEREKNGETDV